MEKHSPKIRGLMRMHSQNYTRDYSQIKKQVSELFDRNPRQLKPKIYYRPNLAPNIYDKMEENANRVRKNSSLDKITLDNRYDRLQYESAVDQIRYNMYEAQISDVTRRSAYIKRKQEDAVKELHLQYRPAQIFKKRNDDLNHYIYNHNMQMHKNYAIDIESYRKRRAKIEQSKSLLRSVSPVNSEESQSKPRRLISVEKYRSQSKQRSLSPVQEKSKSTLRSLSALDIVKVKKNPRSVSSVEQSKITQDHTDSTSIVSLVRSLQKDFSVISRSERRTREKINSKSQEIEQAIKKQQELPNQRKRSLFDPKGNGKQVRAKSMLAHYQNLLRTKDKFYSRPESPENQNFQNIQFGT